MARGNEAKKNVENKIINAFGSDYIDIIDKKIYVWAEEAGEKIQVAISLTCPKNNIAKKDEMNFDFESNEENKSSEITSDERKTIEDLMSRLGL